MAHHSDRSSNPAGQHRPDAPAVRVVIIEPNGLARLGLTLSIASLGPYHIEEHPNTPPTGTRHPADLALINHQIWAADPTACRNLAHVQVAILHSDDSAALRAAANLPANGYLIAAQADTHHIRELLANVATDSIALPEPMRRQLLADTRTPIDAATARLTPRERDVLRQLRHANTNQEIAHELGISINSVKRHVTSILHKLGCTNRTQAAQHPTASTV